MPSMHVSFNQDLYDEIRDYQKKNKIESFSSVVRKLIGVGTMHESFTHKLYDKVCDYQRDKDIKTFSIAATKLIKTGLKSVEEGEVDENKQGS